MEGLYFSGFFDAVPLVGHVKGFLHYALGDKDGGDYAMKSASRTTVVMMGGAAGFVIGGNPWAVLGGIAGGEIIDIVITEVDSAVHGYRRPFGIVRQIVDICENPSDLGKWFETIIMVAGDGACGFASGTAYVSVMKFLAKKGILNQFESKQKSLIVDLGKPGEKDFTKPADSSKYMVPDNEPYDKTILWDLENNDEYPWYEVHRHQLKNLWKIQEQQEAEIMGSKYPHSKIKSPYVEPLWKLQPNQNTFTEIHNFNKVKPHVHPKNTLPASASIDKTNKIRAIKH